MNINTGLEYYMLLLYFSWFIFWNNKAQVGLIGQNQFLLLSCLPVTYR